MYIILLLILAVLIGSLLTAVLVSKKIFGIDIMEHGGGNAGATNTYRVLGKTAGIGVMLVDILKGCAAIQLSHFSGFDWHSVQNVNLQIGLGLCAVVGHIFPIWAGFRGGKGIATLFGMIFAIQPIAAISLIAVFL